MNLTTGAAAALPAVLPGQPVRERGLELARPRPTAATSARTSSAPDPVDRQNLDNYALFTAGGMDFLLLNLEFNAPDDVLDWAQPGARRVPGPPGDRRDPQLRRHGRRASPRRSIAADGGNSGQRDLGEAGRARAARSSSWSTATSTTATAARPAAPTPTPAASRCTRCSPTTRTGPRRRRLAALLHVRPGADEIRAFTYSPFLGPVRDRRGQPVHRPVRHERAGRTSPWSARRPSRPARSRRSRSRRSRRAHSSTGTRRSTTARTTTAQRDVVLHDRAGRPGDPRIGRLLRGPSSPAGARPTPGGRGPSADGSTRSRSARGVGASSRCRPAGRSRATLGSVVSTASDVGVSVGLDRVPTGTAYLTVSGRMVGGADYGARVKVLATGAVQLHTERSRHAADRRHAAWADAGGRRQAARPRAGRGHQPDDDPDAGVEGRLRRARHVAVHGDRLDSGAAGGRGRPADRRTRARR